MFCDTFFETFVKYKFSLYLCLIKTVQNMIMCDDFPLQSVFFFIVNVMNISLGMLTAKNVLYTQFLLFILWNRKVSNIDITKIGIEKR